MCLGKIVPELFDVGFELVCHDFAVSLRQTVKDHSSMSLLL